MTPEVLARLADEPLFRAVKEASGDLRRITRIINLTGDRYRLFAGTDPLALESLIMGASGWVAGLVAAFPRETLAIYRYAINGHLAEARRIYRWFQPLLELATRQSTSRTSSSLNLWSTDLPTAAGYRVRR